MKFAMLRAYYWPFVQIQRLRGRYVPVADRWDVIQCRVFRVHSWTRIRGGKFADIDKAPWYAPFCIVCGRNP